MDVSSHATEIAVGQRFEFGKNWNNFIKSISEDRVRNAVNEIQSTFRLEDLRGMTFLDIGSGSGLSSLAARRLGAKVHSFDYDPKSVMSTELLREKFYPRDKDWTIESGSALDPEYLSALGKFDIVYSWGVLHHTGSMWSGLENALLPLKDDGLLCVAIYNTQFLWTGLHTYLKQNYNKSSILGKSAICALYAASTITAGIFADTLRRRNPITRYRNSNRSRGMSWWHDVVDWAGGYPFETAHPEEIFDFFAGRGCTLRSLKTCGNRHGCNEFVFSNSSKTGINSIESSARFNHDESLVPKQAA